MCDQQSLRSACTYAQSDQSLCKSLEYSMTVKLLTEHHLEFLSFKGGCTGSSESTHAKLQQCWKPHVASQLYVGQKTAQIVHSDRYVPHLFGAPGIGFALLSRNCFVCLALLFFILKILWSVNTLDNVLYASPFTCVTYSYM